KITLVLAQITSAEEQDTSVVAPFQPGEMARGNELCAELVSAVNEPAELQILIAHHAWIGRAAGFVFVGKVLNDLGLKLVGFVDEIVWDAQLVTDRAGVGNGLRSTAFIFGARNAVLWPELECDADDVVALFEQKRGGGGGVYSSTHAADDALTRL